MPSELASSASSVGTSYERCDWSRSRFHCGRIDRETVVPSTPSAPPAAATTWKRVRVVLGRDEQPQAAVARPPGRAPPATWPRRCSPGSWRSRARLRRCAAPSPGASTAPACGRARPSASTTRTNRHGRRTVISTGRSTVSARRSWISMHALRDQRRATEQDESDRGRVAAFDVGGLVRQVPHRRVEGRRAPQEVEDGPAGLQVPGLVVDQPLDGDVAVQRSRSGTGPRPPPPSGRRTGPACPRPIASRTTTVSSTRSMNGYAHRRRASAAASRPSRAPRATSGRPTHRPDPDRDDQRVDDAVPVAARVAPADQEQHAGDQARVDRAGTRRRRSRGTGGRCRRSRRSCR